MREMKRQFCMRWDEMLLIFGLEVGFFLFGEMMLGIMVYGVGEKESIFPLGSMMAVFVPVFIMVFVGMSTLPLHFNIAVGMGAVRRRVVPAMLAMSMIINVMAVWIGDLFFHLEQWIFRVAYAGIKIEFDLSVIFQWKYIFPACLAVVALNALIGALFLKYGKVAFTIFWVLWMAVFIGGPRIAHLLDSTQSNAFLDMCRKVVNIFQGFTENGILSAVMIVSIGLLFVAWMMLRKQQVDI